jgi:signal transduction histidine kinase
MNLRYLLPRTLTQKLSVYIGLATCLVLLATAWLSHRASRRTLDDQTNSEALKQVEAAARHVDDLVARSAMLTRSLAARQQLAGHEPAPDLRAFIINLLDNTPLEEAYGCYIAFERKDWTDADAMPWIDRRSAGQQVKLDYDYHQPRWEWYNAPKRRGAFNITEPYFDAGGSNITMVSLNQPIYDSRKELIGVAGTDLALDRIRDVIGRIKLRLADTEVADEYAFLVSRAGKVIAHPDQSRMLHKDYPGEDVGNLPEGAVTLDRPNGFATVPIQGKPRRIYWATAPLTGWKVVLNVPEAAILAPVTALTHRQLLIGGLAVVLMVGTVFLVAHRIAEPVTQLTRVAAAVESGDYSADRLAPIASRRDELGQLARGFERMVHEVAAREQGLKQAEESLRKAHDELEQRVQERTAELSRTNADLEQTLHQLKETQNQLIAQAKLASLGALTGGIAHEIRNPLNFVTNFAALSGELLQELGEELDKASDRVEPADRENLTAIMNDLEQNITRIRDHGRRADRIVQGMLLHSRGRSGERQLTELNAQLAEDVNLAYHGLRAQDKSFNITIETDYDPSLEPILVVPQELSRVFLNLVNNACYAAHERKKTSGPGFKPVLSVRTKNLGDRVEIRVRDNGNGIPPAVREKLFQPFFTTKPTGVGTGLGLSICYGIVVKDHQGDIRVESEEGKFAEFIVTLPKKYTAPPES